MIMAVVQEVQEIPVQVPLNAQGISDLQNTDQTLQPLIQYLQDGTLPPKWPRRQTWSLLAKANAFAMVQGVLCKLEQDQHRQTKLKIVIPQVLKSEIIRNCHDQPWSAHLGVSKTYDKIRERFYWDNMYRHPAMDPNMPSMWREKGWTQNMGPATAHRI
jgi:hypothetical protein